VPISSPPHDFHFAGTPLPPQNFPSKKIQIIACHAMPTPLLIAPQEFFPTRKKNWTDP
jgi:hypothetical protein